MDDAYRQVVQPLRRRQSPETEAKPFAAWRAQVAALFEATLPEGADDAAFSADSVSYQLPNGFLTISTLSAVELLRSAALIERSPNESVLIFQCLTGQVSANYDGVATVLLPGDFAFIDYQRPIWSRSTDGLYVSMTFGRAALAKIFRSGDLHGVRLDPGAPATALLSAVTTTLVETIARLTVEEAEAGFDAVLRIAEVAWRAAGEGPRGRREQVMFNRAVALLRGGMGDPDFSATQIQKDLKISRATLYRLFAPYGGVRQFLIRLRLDASVYDLIGRKAAAGAISAAAYRHGFKSEAHFSRAFKQRFHVLPREVVGLGSDAVGPSTQIDAASNDPEGGADAMRTWLRSMIRRDAAAV